MADLRKCIGSAKFGLEAHEAPVEDFPVQPSQKDGLGRMCKPHWTEYTRALRNASKGEPVEGAPAIVMVRPAKAEKSIGAKLAALNEERRVAAEAKKVAKAKPGRKAGTAASASRKPAQRRDASPEETAAHNATVREEARASMPDWNAIADQHREEVIAEEVAVQDEMLAERKARVKAWRKSEVQGTPMEAPGASTDTMEA